MIALLAVFACLLLPSHAAAQEDDAGDANKALLVAFWQAEATRAYGEMTTFFAPNLVRVEWDNQTWNEQMAQPAPAEPPAAVTTGVKHEPLEPPHPCPTADQAINGDARHSRG